MCAPRRQAQGRLPRGRATGLATGSAAEPWSFSRRTLGRPLTVNLLIAPLCGLATSPLAANATSEAVFVIRLSEHVIIAEHADLVVPVVANGADDTLFALGWAAIGILAVASDEVVLDCASQFNLKFISAWSRGSDWSLASEARRARNHAVLV